MDIFTQTRLTRLLENWKKTNGHDISVVQLEEQGFNQEQIKHAIAKGLIEKYQATNATGAKENRYKLLIDWRTINRQ